MILAGVPAAPSARYLLLCQIRGSELLQLADGLLHGVHDLAGADHGGDLVHVQIDGAVLVHEGDLAADHVIGGLGALAQLGAVLKVGGLGGAQQLDGQDHLHVALPHVIAATLVNAVKKLDDPEQHMKMIAAGGFKDITRIASSSPEMWQNICQENSANIAEVIDAYIEMLQAAKAKVMEPDGTGVYSMFEESRDYRNSFGDLSAGPIKKKFAFTCDLYDEPGGIATITIMLGMRGLSIKNIGIVHNRSFAEGALEIEFYTEEAMQQAIELLRARNYTLYVRD